MRLQRRIAAIVGTLLLGIVGAIALEAPASAATYGPYKLVHASGYCLEVPNSSYNYGEQLRLNYCTGAPNQRFWFEDAGYDWAYFIHPAHSGYCIVPGVSSLVDSTVIQWPCNYQTGQVWILGFGQQYGSRTLYHPYSGMCAGVNYAYAGAYVRENGCAGSYRTWTLAY